MLSERGQTKQHANFTVLTDLMSQLTFKLLHFSIFGVFPPGTKSMGNPWKYHRNFMGKNPWIPMKTMEHGARAKFHGFHGDLSMLAWDRKSARIIPHETMESMGYKTIENMGGMGICENENMESIGSMVFSSILLSIISGKHGKIA